jgi:glycosyltransferase involved in cell wall biosynthesis
VLVLRRALSGVQIIHAHSGRAQNLAFLAALRLPVVRVMTRHVAFEPRYAWIHALKYGAGCHGVIAVSEAVRRVLVKAGVPESRIEVIANGVKSLERETSAEERRAARLRYGIDENDFALGHLGAFTPEKGQDVAMEAFGILRDRMPSLRMILAGDGAPAEAPDARVLLPGFVANRKEFFAALDLFIMPSRSEGWGLAAAEALAHGIPVIASDTGGLASIVEPGETGWLVSPGDTRALARAIEEAASDPQRLKEMSSRARKHSARYSPRITAELTEAFYRGLMAQSSA